MRPAAPDPLNTPAVEAARAERWLALTQQVAEDAAWLDYELPGWWRTPRGRASADAALLTLGNRDLHDPGLAGAWRILIATRHDAEGLPIPPGQTP